MVHHFELFVMTLKLSVLGWTEQYRAAQLLDAVRRLEAFGYHELWLPELNGREPFSTCGFLLAKTEKLRISPGIANVYVRDALAAAQGRRTLSELSGGRLSLGLGVSHPNLIEPRGHTWQSPVAKMREYISAIRAAEIDSPAPPAPAPIIIAAHARGLWRVAADQADGILTNLLVPHTLRAARSALGPEKQIHSLVRCVMETDPERARAAVRRTIGFYLALPAYQRAWAEAGYNEADWGDGGSDRLIDALSVRGSPQQIKAGLETIVQAGATHIVLVAVPTEAASTASDVKRWNWQLLEQLAPNRE